MATLTAGDVARKLQVSRDTAVGYLARQVIPGAYQVVAGGRWLIDVDDFERWREQRKASVDPHRIEPRSARSQAARNRRRTA